MWKKAKEVIFADDEVSVHRFIRACDTNNITMIKKYIRQNIDPNCHEGNYVTGLHIAAEHNYYNLAKILLQLPGVDVNIRDCSGCTPLYRACARNYESIAKLLLEHYADINIPNKNGTTPLHNSVLSRNYDLVELLLANGAIVDCENIYGKTPLYMAVLDSPNELNIEILISYGANIDINNGKILPILVEGALACTDYEQLDMLDFFLKSGCNVNIGDKLTGRTALHMVAISNYVPLADVLISNGADYNIKDCTNKTPMDIAVTHRNHEIITFLNFVKLMQ